MSFVTAADGVAVAVRDFGGRGAPVVLVHATSFHGRVWEPMAAALSDRFRCVSFDMRGHGDSGAPPDGDYHWQGFARDALAVVDALGLEQPYGVGHSSGATALLLAEQARPGTFRALYCYEPVVVAADPALGRDRGNWLAAAARRRRDVFPSRDHAYDHFASKPPLSALHPAALRAYVDHGFADVGDGTVRLKCRPESEALSYEMATANDCYPRLGEITCPVTIAWGADTDAFSPGGADAIAAHLQRARTDTLAGLGHFGPLQEPGAVALSVLHGVGGYSAG